MTTKSIRSNLLAVKLALAKKYQTLASAASSRTKQSQFSKQSETYRRQAAKLAR